MKQHQTYQADAGPAITIHGPVTEEKVLQKLSENGFLGTNDATQYRMRHTIIGFNVLRGEDVHYRFRRVFKGR